MYHPPAAQPPVATHDTESVPAFSRLFKAAVPGTSMAFPHRPSASVTTNACWPERSVYQPPAAQLPTEHDTELIWAWAFPLFRAAVPGTSMAFPHRPFASVTTNA